MNETKKTREELAQLRSNAAWLGLTLEDYLGMGHDLSRFSREGVQE